MEYLKAKTEKRKKLNKTYLKGQRGVRRYYDYSKLDYDDDEEYTDDEDKDIDNEDINKENIDIDSEDIDDEYIDDEKERPVKCVFKKDLRREKLFAYLKYLNGKKILVRDLAWHFAVTERTIQMDLRWLENNDFIITKTNKTYTGKQTKKLIYSK